MCNVLDAGAERWAPHTFPSGKVPPKGADEGRGALMDSFACSAKRNCSPTLISQPAADSFPQGKLKGPQQIGTAAKERYCVPAGGVEPRPYGMLSGWPKTGVIYRPNTTALPTGVMSNGDLTINALMPAIVPPLLLMGVVTFSVAPVGTSSKDTNVMP